MNLKPLATIMVKHPKTVVLVFTIFTLVIGSQIQNIYMESDLSGYLPQDTKVIELWNEINDEFDIGSTIVIYVEADDIRDPYVLREMDRVTNKINKYNLDKGEKDGIVTVMSIAALIKEENAKPISVGGLGGTGQFAIPEDINLITRYLARLQQYEGSLFLKNFKVTVIIIQLSDNIDYNTVLTSVEEAIEKEARYADMTITGAIAMQHAIQEASMESITIVFPLAVLFISIVIFFFHRTVKGIIIVFLPLLFALMLTFGTLGLVQPELSVLAIAIVALLVGLGVDYSIHLLNRFAEEKTVEDKILRVEKTLKRTGKAVLLSSITTVIGFSSLMVSSMKPLVTFGFGCAIGIMFCFLSASILVPCLALILKFEKNGYVSNWKKFANFAVENRKRVIVVACFFAVMSMVVLPNITSEVNYVEMAPEGLPEVEKLFEYSENFGGGANVNMLLVETNPQGLTYPEVIEAIYDMEEEMRRTGVTVTSIADQLKEINEILDRNAIVEKISDYVEVDQIVFDTVAKNGLVDSEFSKTILFVYFPVGLSMEQIELLVDSINDIATSWMIPEGGRVSYLTGQDAVNVEINNQLYDQQSRSLIIALLLVLAVLILIFNSSIYGFLTMIPVGFVLVWEPGFLVLLDIPLSVVTIAIASIMIGIGIDYGIHLTERVREGINAGMSKTDATKDAIEKTGLSLVEAACTTLAGMSSVFFSNIPVIQQFGAIVILMTAFSLIAAVLILPIFYGLKAVK